MAELAKEFRVSRKTAYKWLGRFAREGDLGLAERSRAPHQHPNATPMLVVSRPVGMLQAKAAHLTWGPAKLLPPPEASAELAAVWPATSTRGSILARHGLVSARRRRRRVTPWAQPFQYANGPNAVWCADFKGWSRRVGTQTAVPMLHRDDPLTISDAFSRMLLCCQIVPKPDYAHVRPVFERVFQEYGLPQAIRTDNGVPFASVGAGGLSPLAAWWVKLGILPERIRPGHPQENGRHERMHRTLKAETMHPPAATPAAQQKRCDAFRKTYPDMSGRPHQALGQVPPATQYVPSQRHYPLRVHDPVYPPLTEVRRVRSNGQMKWHGELVFVSPDVSGVGELVGVAEHSRCHRDWSPLGQSSWDGCVRTKGPWSTSPKGHPPKPN